MIHYAGPGSPEDLLEALQFIAVLMKKYPSIFDKKVHRYKIREKDSKQIVHIHLFITDNESEIP